MPPAVRAQSLNHWTTRKVPCFPFLKEKSIFWFTSIHIGCGALYQGHRAPHLTLFSSHSAPCLEIIFQPTHGSRCQGHPNNQMGFFDGSAGKESACHCSRRRRLGLIPGLGRFPGGGNGNPTAVFLPEKKKPHEQRNLVGYSPKSCKESDMTEEHLSTPNTIIR